MVSLLDLDLFLVFVGLDLDGFFGSGSCWFFSLGLDLDSFSFSTGFWFFSVYQQYGHIGQ